MANSYGSSNSWDNKYANGDDLNYFGGLIRQRVLAKPKPATSGSAADPLTFGLGNGLIWSTTGTSALLNTNVDTDMFTFSNNGELQINPAILSVFIKGNSPIVTQYNSQQNQTEISLNYGDGLKLSGSPSDTTRYLQISLRQDASTDDNISGLAFWGSSSKSLGIQLDGAEISNVFTNTSGLEIVAPHDESMSGTTVSYIGGLRINASQIAGKGLTNTGVTLDINYDTDSFNIPSSGEKADKLVLKAATATTLGGVIAAAVRSGSISSTTGGLTSGRYYGVELDSNNKMFVNVPWEANTDTWRSIKTNHNSTVTEVVGSATSTGDIVFFDGTGIDVSPGTNSIQFNLKQATASVLGGIKAISYEGNAQQYYDSAIDGVAIDISSTNTGRLHLKLANTDAPGVVQLVDSISDEDVTHAPTPNAVYHFVSTAIADLEGIDFQIASSLPSVTTEAQYKQYKGTIYLIPLSNPVDGSTPPDTNQADRDDYYEEFVLIDKGSTYNPRYVWEKIGDTSFTIQNLGQTNVDAIITAAFGF